MPESDSPDFQTRIGPYSILGELGRGGMGVVYRAHDPRLERDIALKILPGEFAAQPWRRDRFLQEARLLATLNHPNISTVHSLEESNGLHFLTMELVPGVMLAERIEEGSIGIDDALSIGRQIARALEAAHARGVIHRDLKPRNIMLTPDGTVKVLDFGLARSLSELDGKEVPETSKGSPGSVDISSNDLGLGTPGYMSPEQIFDEKVGTGTDIWAFGCVLMEVLTGSIVFGGETAWERIHSTMIDVDLDRLPVETPPPLRGLIQRCLNRDPVERPPSMGDARHELEELIEARRLSVLLARLKRATSPHPTNLPHRVTSFIGREREISAVTGALVPGRLVTLTGAGGCGKTRLAIEVAERRLPDHGDGVWLIEFGALSRPELATGAVVSALGLTGDPTRPPLDLLRDHLVTSNALLVLDNCEHLLEACGDLVAGLLATCPGLHILATSREALRVPGEQLFAVPTLSVPPSASLASSEDSGESEAVRLFVDRARLVRPDFQLTAGNAEAVNKICRRLDGIPLALELAAARAQSLSAEEIAQRLDRRFQLLTGGPRTMPRHQTLRALIDWSYEQLEDKEQAVLRRLSVFPGSWTLGAAEAVCAGERIADWEVVDLFCRLVDKSLVEHDADASASSGKARYRMLETVRTYARDRLSEAGEEPDAWRRHRRYFSSLALEAEPHFAGSEQGTWFTRLETDLDNIRAALAACMDDEAGIEMGLVMAAALREFWEVRGHWSEARQIFQRLLAHPMTRDRLSHARGLALSAAAHMAWYQSELDQAHVLNEECLTIARQILDEPLMARALSGLAILASDRGQYERARSLYEECLSIRRRLGDARAIATILNNLGDLAMNEGDDPRSLALYEESLSIRRQHGIIRGIGVSLSNLSGVLIRLGELERAREYAEECVPILRKLGETSRVADALHNRGLLEFREGRLEEARGSLSTALEIRRDLVDRHGLIHSCEAFSHLAAATARPRLAAQLLGAAEGIRTEVKLILHPGNQRELGPLIESLRQTLGHEPYEAERTRGLGLGWHGAVPAIAAWNTDDDVLTNWQG